MPDRGVRTDRDDERWWPLREKCASLKRSPLWRKLTEREYHAPCYPPTVRYHIDSYSCDVFCLTKKKTSSLCPRSWISQSSGETRFPAFGVAFGSDAYQSALIWQHSGSCPPTVIPSGPVAAVLPYPYVFGIAKRRAILMCAYGVAH